MSSPSFGSDQLPNPNASIGWIGTGVMGLSMAGHLIDAGLNLSVFNRSPQKCQPLVDRGAKRCESAAEVAAESAVVITMVGMPADVESVYFGSESDPGILAAISEGSFLIDFTTSSPDKAIEIARVAAGRNIGSLDAPVSGGDVGARNGSLSIMVGGDEGAFNAMKPIFNLVGKTVVHQGPAGCGQHTKMVNQTLVATGMISICEALLYAEAAGLDLPTVLQSVSSGAAGSWSLTNLAPRIIDGNFEPGFYVEHFIKDLRIVLDEADRMNLSLPGLALAKQLYVATAAAGDSRSGTQALYKTLARLNGRVS